MPLKTWVAGFKILKILKSDIFILTLLLHTLKLTVHIISLCFWHDLMWLPFNLLKQFAERKLQAYIPRCHMRPRTTPVISVTENCFCSSQEVFGCSLNHALWLREQLDVSPQDTSNAHFPKIYFMTIMQWSHRMSLERRHTSCSQAFVINTWFFSSWRGTGRERERERAISSE